MREWKHGEVCSHGSLGRKCEICWRDDEIAALRARAEKAEAEAAEWKAASAINGSNMAGYQTRSIVAEERLVKAEARAERLAAEVIAWRRAAAIFDGSGNPLGIHFFQHTHGARVAVDAHRDLEGKEHVGGVCWMIERGQRHGEVEPLYWTGADWSKDPCKGMRFANSRAATDYAVAEVLLSGIEGVHPRKWEVTEHVFMDAHRDLEGGAA